MIGQTKLLNKLNNYTLDTFPHSMLLIGEKGCGKHTLVNYIKDNILKLPLLDITSNLSNELIDNIYRTSTPNIYLIDLSLITEKDQNTILKFVEEPLQNSFIILICENKNFVINTVLNRCICFEFGSYSVSELKQFTSEPIDDMILLNILNTPGKLKNINLVNISEMAAICDKIINKLHIASLGNTLTIKDKINFKDEYDKFDFNIFLDLLSYLMYNQFLETNNKIILDMYKTLEKQRKSLLDLRINKEMLFENLLIKLWKGVRYGY